MGLFDESLHPRDVKGEFAGSSAGKALRTRASKDAVVSTTRLFSKVTGVTPGTKRFVLRDSEGLRHDGNTQQHILAALAREDKTPGLLPGHRTAAYAVSKSMNTGRMDPTLESRIRGYTPYQTLKLVATIHTAHPDATVGELADFWINQHAAEL